MLGPNFPEGAAGVFALIPLVLCCHLSAEELIFSYFPSLGSVDGVPTKDMGIAQKHWGKVRRCEGLELTEMGLTLQCPSPGLALDVVDIYQVVGLVEMESCPSCTFC